MHLKSSSGLIDSELQGEQGKLHALMWLWDPDALAPVRATGGAGTGTEVEVMNFPATLATTTLQTTGNAKLDSVITGLTNLLTELQAKADLAETQPISAASLPLPTNASTSALQTTGNTSVASIDTKTPALGQAVMASSSPVAIASDQNPLADLTVSGTLGANTSDTVEINTEGRGQVTFSLTGTWTGTCVFETWINNNAGWIFTTAITTGTSAAVASSSTANVSMEARVAGYKKFRIRKSVAGTGTVQVDLNASIASNYVRAYNTATGNFPVSAGQNGTWTVQQGSTPSSTPWSMDLRRAQTILFGSISTAAAGDTTLVAAVASNKIKVLSYTFVCTSANSVKFKSGASDITGAMACSANGGVAQPPGSPGTGWYFETAVNTDLIINLSAATQVSGHFSYIVEA